jgi:glutathione peroxidase
MKLKEIEIVMLDGSTKSFGDVQGKVTLVVNVASRCGLSPQYETLEAMHKKYHDKGFTVLGVPSNQFFQELKNSDDISEYCSTTWGVTFPMTEKAKLNGKNAHPLYKELTKANDAEGNAGNVKWNFEKFLVLENGDVMRFRPTTKPDDERIISAIEENLAK